MKRCLYQALSVLVLLGAVVACASPGQAVHSTPAVNPGIDSNAVGTAVAGTAQAAAQQTAASAELFAPSATGTDIDQLPDKTIKYTDYDAGFEIIFPIGWLALRPNSEEFDDALAKQGAANSMLRDQMTADLAGYQANYDRIYSYVLRPDIQKDFLFGFSKLVLDLADATPIDNDAMGNVVRGLEAPGGVPGFHADIAQVREDGPVKMIEIGGRWLLSDGAGGSVPFYSTLIFFKPSASSGVRLTISFLEKYRPEISADVKSIIASIKLIEQ
ncbi:MAG TPA: hypothetical protein VHP14_00840 [Anaerolineales bacterium]|nr:hypothetical protein [Anaerolineales bacterium]